MNLSTVVILVLALIALSTTAEVNFTKFHGEIAIGKNQYSDFSTHKIVELNIFPDSLSSVKKPNSKPLEKLKKISRLDLKEIHEIKLNVIDKKDDFWKKVRLLWA